MLSALCILPLYIQHLFKKYISYYLPPLLDVVEQHLVVRARGAGNPHIISKSLLFKSYLSHKEQQYNEVEIRDWAEAETIHHK